MPKAPARSPAGYSGKPLIAKLGWKADMAALAINPPEHYAELTDAAPSPQRQPLPEPASTPSSISLSTAPPNSQPRYRNSKPASAKAA